MTPGRGDEQQQQRTQSRLPEAAQTDSVAAEPGARHRPGPRNDVIERRLARLREELRDEGIALPVDGPAGPRLLAEVTYARRPPRHERRAPTYGSLVFSGVPDWDNAPFVPVLLAGDGVAVPALRRCADGRSSFAVVTPDGLQGLATFDASFDDELAVVRLQRIGATIVQRRPSGLLRVCTSDGVVTWDGSSWQFKPMADDYVDLVLQLAPQADRAVLAGLLELAVHALAATGVGATLVWNIDGAPASDDRQGLVEQSQAIHGPALSVTRRAHFAALVSIHSQIDLATIISADGEVGPIGARLAHTAESAATVAPLEGARHTSARRFTFDVPGTLALVVSESSRVTILSGGAVAAHIRSGRSPSGGADDGGEPEVRIVVCPRCAKRILVQGPDQADMGAESTPRCPVCDEGIPGPPGARVIGVPVDGLGGGRPDPGRTEGPL